MDISENDYCRLCADFKQCSDLTNMEINIEKRQEIVNKLMRFNIKVDFDNMLPKTVCFECVNSLESAYDFVTTVDQAQEAFTDYISASDVKKDEVVSDTEIVYAVISDNETMDEPPEPTNEEVKVKDEPNTNFEDEIKVEYVIDRTKPKLKKPVKVEDTEKIKEESKKDNSKSKSKTLLTNKSIIPIESVESWNDYSWLCAYCDKFYQTPSELKIHSMQYHSTCNPYRCFDCRARGLHMDNFLAHIGRHRPILVLSCYKCAENCTSVEALKEHMETHPNYDNICIGCNTTFSTQEELDEHRNMYYKNAEANNLLAVTDNDSLSCVICKKTLKTRVLLNRHLLIHTERKRDHVCDVCNKSFYHKKELVQHIVIHSDARPFKCEVCKFSFKIKAELKKHASIHFGPKEFACDKCGKCFRLKKELIKHSAVHKDVRPFKCTECDKTFRFKHLLQQHLLLHSGTKPYSCKICSMTFRNWSNFNKHSKESHGVDNSRRRRTREGLYAIDPTTKKVIYPERKKVLEWKNKVLVQEKRGRPKKIVEHSGNVEKSKKQIGNKKCYK